MLGTESVDIFTMERFLFHAIDDTLKMYAFLVIIQGAVMQLLPSLLNQSASG